MSEETKKYRCKNCKRETSIVTLDAVYSGCPHCFGREWQEFVEGEWIDKEFRNPRLDALMRHLST
jgi:Zn finger protein HypA/HybF involved in hydrogenase expression